MIERLTVRTFKSLENVTVDLGLVNVFIGANGSGKSNLLEALGVLSAAADGKVDDMALDDTVMKRAEQGWSLSRLWVMGHLGGVPDV